MLVRFMQTDGKRVAVPVADVRVVTEIDERTTAVTRRNVHSGEGASYTSEIAEPFSTPPAFAELLIEIARCSRV